MITIGKKAGLWATLGLIAVTGCAPMSERVAGPSGLNGGFEEVANGLPVNWLVYSPRTIPTGRYELLFDREQRKEGRQSLSFRVEECSPTGGWHSPGIAQELVVEAARRYRVSFWIKNDGCRYVVHSGGVAAKIGDLEVIDSDEMAPGKGWKRVERELTIPEQYPRLRFELSIRSPGQLWIDDVEIEPLPSDAHTAADCTGLDGAVVVLG